MIESAGSRGGGEVAGNASDFSLCLFMRVQHTLIEYPWYTLPSTVLGSGDTAGNKPSLHSRDHWSWAHLSFWLPCLTPGIMSCPAHPSSLPYSGNDDAASLERLCAALIALLRMQLHVLLSAAL